MRGFSNEFKDLPDYILKITREIWEDRGLATLHDYYAKDLPMRFPSGLVTGNLNVINGTMATLAEFPDRELLGEDVIWSGDEEAGFLSSHRLLTTGTHLGHGSFGKPTGQRFVIRAIADCAAKDNAIYDEWLIRDVSGIVKQLGKDVKKFTRKMIDREGGVEECVRPFTPDHDVDGGYRSRGNDNEWGQKLSDILTRIMEKDFAVIPSEYDRACHIYHPGARDSISHQGADRAWLPLRASFPSAQFEIHHVIGRDDPMMSPRAALRWSLTGKHDGYGLFGAPSGATVHVMGMTHAEFGPYGLRNEYTLFDEVAIWKQIMIHQG
ncbi:MAG: ester cyclase [Pseudomonadota bacterium]